MINPNYSRKELFRVIQQVKRQNSEARVELFLCKNGLDFSLNKLLSDRVIVGALHGEDAISKRLESYIEKIKLGNKSPNRVIIIENINAFKNNAPVLMQMNTLLSIVRQSGMSVISINDVPNDESKEEMGRVLSFNRMVQ